MEKSVTRISGDNFRLDFTSKIGNGNYEKDIYLFDNEKEVLEFLISSNFVVGNENEHEIYEIYKNDKLSIVNKIQRILTNIQLSFGEGNGGCTLYRRKK